MNWKSLLNSERVRPTNRESSEQRDEIVRDYGRAVFSTPVRRLQDKAQVFPLEPIDAVRRRLTHSLEVSSIARDLTHAAVTRLRNKNDNLLNEADAYAIESIAATAGLLHDIGNPPFGHAGETAIRDWFTKLDEPFSHSNRDLKDRLRRDFTEFDGNPQTLRLISKLQILSDRHGLNLTFATLSATCKYTAGSHEIKTPENYHERSKLGHFTSEDDLVGTIREKTGTETARNPITFLVEASDDIVYSVVDIEDAIKKGVVSWGDGGGSTNQRQSHCIRDILLDSQNGIDPEILKETLHKAEEHIDKSTFSNVGRSRDEAIAQYFRTLVIGRAVRDTTECFVKNYEQIMAGEYHKEILFDDANPMGSFYRVLKEEIARKHVYPAKSNLRLELLGRKVIQDLLGFFHEADPKAKGGAFSRKVWGLLSQNYKTVYDNPSDWEKELPEEYRRLQLITDYICGMTDSFAINLHKELFNG